MHSVIVTCVLLAAAACVQGLDVDIADVVAAPFTKIMFKNTDKAHRMFLMFYAPWCGHCKRLAPTWDDLAKKYNTDGDNNQVIIGKVDCTVEKELCADHGIRGYPTMKFFSKNSEPEKYTRQRTIDDLTAFIEEQLAKEVEGGKEETDEEEEESDAPKAVADNGLYQLTDADFESHTQKGDHFIKFFAPWCGHCKRMAQAWMDLAAVYKDSDKVTIAEVDCTKHSATCSKHGVRGYPTVMWFTGGQKNADYHSGRSLPDLQAYVNTMIGAEMDESKQSEDGKIPEGKPKAGEKTPEDLDEESPLIVLEPTDFDESVSEDYTFVMFVEHANPACEQGLNVMEKLAKSHIDSELVLYAVMDCTVNINMCTLIKAEGPYPLFQLYHNGEMIVQYKGDVSEDAISKYVNNKVKEMEGKKEKQEQKKGKQEEKKEKKAHDHGGEL